ncbi:MAG TPA: tetratricopeptide repeat protein [Sphingomicrobium sp.]|nr:tetratricopeptide repeat protein [Sphingomicrobium sp.]
MIAEAVRLLEQNRLAEAAARVVPLLESGNRDPDLLMLYATICERSGRADEALGACRAALDSAPGRADLWASVGRILFENGNPAEAMPYLKHAVAIEAGNPNFWYNLALAADAAGDDAQARSAHDKTLALAPQWAAAWAARGALELRLGNPEAAERDLRRALELDPASAYARHYLAIALRELDRADEALPLLEGQPAAPVETRVLHAHLLDDVGRGDEAVKAYSQLIAENPHNLEAQERLARILPQLGRRDEALAAYESALASQPSVDLYRSALGAAKDLRDSKALLHWSEQAITRFGSAPDLVAYRGIGFGLAGDPDSALECLEPLAAGGFSAVLAHCAVHRLKRGDLQEAERHALAATRENRFDQAAWAYLTVIWRLLEDPREKWLADYERLVMPIELEPPAGFATIKEFMGSLAAELERLHTRTEHPAEQSLREGTQTSGNLFARRIELIAQLRDTIRQSVEARTAELAVDPEHPFLSRRTDSIRFVGSWSVRLRSGGFHINHIHQEGWLSSALYVALPEGMGSRSDAKEGSLVFGIPDTALGLDLEPRRIERPEVGRLVVFPSYFWHGTVPFAADTPRMTVAFDAVPA